MQKSLLKKHKEKEKFYRISKKTQAMTLWNSFSNRKALLAIIVISAFFVRLYNLENVPKGFYLDEASNGYNAYKILTTGKDEWGIPTPLYFKAFGEYKNPVFIYSTVPSIAIFGLSVFSVRLVSAIYGTLAVIATFLLVRKMFGEKEGLIASLLLAFSPWHLLFSRVAFEAITMPTLFLFGLFFLLKANEKKLFVLLSAVCFALAIYSYKIAYAFVPFFLLGFFTIYRKKFSLEKVVMFVLFLSLFLLPLFFEFALNEEHRNAINQKNTQLSIFNQKFTKEKESKGVSREQAIIWLYLENYTSYFSFDFLFIKGDRLPRHSVPEKGQLYFFYIPLLVVGATICFFRKNEADKLTLFWLISWPVVAAFGADYSPHALRSITAISIFEIICALAFVKIFWKHHPSDDKKIRTSLLFLAFCIFACWEIVSFIYSYFYEYPDKAGFYFNCGYEEAFKFTEQEKQAYKKVYIEPEVLSYDAHILALFFLKLDSEKFHYDRELGKGYEILNTENLERPSLVVSFYPAKIGLPLMTVRCSSLAVLEISEFR
ncbi:MAG: glycosyltransferase family 39 protein [Candidatus Diapherotrites archaeon]